MTAAVQDKTTMLSTRQAAIFIGMSMSFLRMARCEGHRGNRTPGPPFYRIGKVVRYSTTDLRAWLDARRCETGAAIAKTENELHDSGFSSRRGCR